MNPGISNPEPNVSVVIPVHNGEESLGACLGALRATRYPNTEIIVVDDGSTDRSAAIAEGLADRVIRLKGRNGPAVARNRGAKEARGEIILFTDADVFAEPDTVEKVVAAFQEKPGLAATFGLYRPTTVYSNFFSVFKNLIHHYTHLTSSEEAWTFWSGCGAIRRDIFEQVGGFDERYVDASVEDIELGYRLWQQGYRTFLNKKLCVTHCKRYGLRDLVHSDFFHRAVPWTKLMLERRMFRSDLNLALPSAASVPTAYLVVLCLLGSFMIPQLLVPAGLLGGFFVLLNRDFYAYALRVEGLRFTLGAVLMHFFYYLYGGTGFAAGGIAYLGDKRRR